MAHLGRRLWDSASVIDLGQLGSADFSGGREREYQEYSVIFAK